MVDKSLRYRGRRGGGRLRKVNLLIRPDDLARIHYLLDLYMSSSASHVVRVAVKNFAEHWQEAGQRCPPRKRTRSSTPDHSWSRRTVYMRTRDFKRVGTIRSAAGLPSSSEAIRSAIRWEAERQAVLDEAARPPR
jgi:Arc/MetJ-type ribon-helix-helix transcriptional regulator